MILSTSENKILHIYAFATVFCFIFFLIYNQFSHGVHSPFMTFLFVWPLVLGLMPAAIRVKFLKPEKNGFWAANLYHSGVATLTVSSALKGILDIAGTTSDYQLYLMMAGFVLLIAGIVLLRIENREKYKDRNM